MLSVCGPPSGCVMEAKVEKSVDWADAERNRGSGRQVDHKELKELLEDLPRGVDETSGLATDIAELAARMQPAKWLGVPLNKAVPLCLNAVFRRTVDWEEDWLNDRRVLPFFACTTKYLYVAVLRARSVTNYSLASVITPYSHIEVAVKMADAKHLAMLGSDADPTAADQFLVRRADQLRRWTKHAGSKEAPMIRAETTISSLLGKGVTNLGISLQRVMEDFGI